MYRMAAVLGVMTLGVLVCCDGLIAQQKNVTIVPGFQGKSQPPDLEWEYELTFSGIESSGSHSLVVTVPVRRNLFWSIADSDISKVENHSWQGNDWYIVPKLSSIVKKQFTVKIRARGPESQVRHKSDGLNWRFGIDGQKAGTHESGGPEPTPAGVRLLFAVGTDIGLDDYIDFKEENDHLLTMNDSRSRASGLIGVAFKVGTLKKRPWDFFASLNFVDNTTKTVDGFVFGTSIPIANRLGIGVGYSLRKKSELSIGFQRAAANFLNTTSRADLKTRFPLDAGGNFLEREKLFDGLPLLNDAGNRYFPGSPIVDSFNHSLFIGFTFPIGIKSLFTSAQRQ